MKADKFRAGGDDLTIDHPQGVRRPKVYLSSRITGDINYRTRFSEVASKLDGLGFDTYNPAELPEREDWEWADYMKHHIPELVKCDGICVFGDWQNSKGALLERHVARGLGMFVVEL